MRATGALELRPAARLALLRIAQEAVANALRHARPTRVEVMLDGDVHEVRLTVTDDGNVIWAVAPTGRGLLNLRARAEELGDGLAIERAAPRSTRVTASIPMRE